MNAVFGRRAVRASTAALLLACVSSWAHADVFESDSNGTVDIYGAPNVTESDGGIPGASKIDGFMFELSQYAEATPGTLTPDLLRVIEPQASFLTDPPWRAAAVRVEIVAGGSTSALVDALKSLGFMRPSLFGYRISGWLPVDQIMPAANLDGLQSLRLSLAKTRTGAVTSQGDFAQSTDRLRAPFVVPGLTGKGVTVGILSDSFNCLGGYATDQSTGDLPAGIVILEESPDCTTYGSDEGRAMAQIIADVAPGANMAFYTASNGEADFANGILALAEAGARVIVDDVGYFQEPVFQDGIVAQAIDQVKAAGVAYFSAAGNEGNNSFEGPFINSGVMGGLFKNDFLMNFDGTQATTTTELPITIPGHSISQQPVTATIILQWDQPFANTGKLGPGSNVSMHLCITNGNGTRLRCSFFASGIGFDPVQVVSITNLGLSDRHYGIQVAVRKGIPPGLVKIIYADDGAGGSIDQFQTHSGTIQGHPGAAGAAAVGAAFYFNTPKCGTTPAVAEPYSSWGGDPILFDTDGRRLEQPDRRKKPDFVAPDGGNTTFFGGPFNNLVNTSISQCEDQIQSGTTYYPGFFGTSAAAPHAAGMAALMLEASPNATPDTILSAMRASGQDMGSPGFDYQNGYGLIAGDVALANLPTQSYPTKDGGGGAIPPTLLLSLASFAWYRRRRTLRH